ncbi:MAG: trypsin-like peptidase domain-containing protein [Chloroflexi bacterium]|nr:trypsin-like peptidase domain-containing protein [Chloroflexota bacterium]
MQSRSVLHEVSSEMASVVQRARRSVVEILDDGGGRGAGTVWHRDGLILTNAHVVRDRALRVSLADGRVLAAKVVAVSKEHDLAALTVDAEDLPAIAVGDSRRVMSGELVLAIGHPWGQVGAVTSGVAIGLESHDGSGREWLAINMQLRPGNSGGPLLDSEGRLIGINTIMSGPNVGLAVPSHVAKGFLTRELEAAA